MSNFAHVAVSVLFVTELKIKTNDKSDPGAGIIFAALSDPNLTEQYLGLTDRVSRRLLFCMPFRIVYFVDPFCSFHLNPKLIINLKVKFINS